MSPAGGGQGDRDRDHDREGGTSRAFKFPLPLERVGKIGTPAKPRETLRPQRHLHESARDASRPLTLQGGLGLDTAVVRARMVQRLRDEGQGCEPVLAAMQRVPRHLFVDTALAAQGYEDTSLPIGHGQTISKPSVVARMVQLLYGGVKATALGHLGRTLEVGTGCGYQTAVLAQLASWLVSIERLQLLHDKAVRHLADAQLAAGRLDHLRLLHGDGMLGHAPGAPFDTIIAAAGGRETPQAWLDQLAVGGRLVAPVHGAGGRGQVLVVVDRHATGWARSEHDGVHFVPLKSGIV